MRRIKDVRIVFASKGAGGCTLGQGLARAYGPAGHDARAGPALAQAATKTPPDALLHWRAT